MTGARRPSDLARMLRALADRPGASFNEIAERADLEFAYRWRSWAYLAGARNHRGDRLCAPPAERYEPALTGWQLTAAGITASRAF